MGPFRSLALRLPFRGAEPEDYSSLESDVQLDFRVLTEADIAYRVRFWLWWARQDSNLRPSPCQGDVLTRLRRRFNGVLDDEPRLGQVMMAYQAFPTAVFERVIESSNTAYTSSIHTTLFHEEKNSALGTRDLPSGISPRRCELTCPRPADC